MKGRNQRGHNFFSILIHLIAIEVLMLITNSNHPTLESINQTLCITCDHEVNMNLTEATTTTETNNNSNLIRKSIALNHAGIYCMESNNTVEAIKLFTVAFKTHLDLVTKKNFRSSSRSLVPSGTTGTIDQNQPSHLVRSVSASSPSSSSTVNFDLSSLSLRQQLRLKRSINVDDFFVSLPEQYLYHTTSSCNWTAYRDLIRIPPIEELPLTLSFAWEVEEEEANHGKNDDDDCSNPREEKERFLGFILTSYAFNLALAHHQRGYELSLFDTSDDSRLIQQYSFNRAGRLYELTMNLEKIRSNAAIILEDEQIQRGEAPSEERLHSSVITDPNLSSKSTWFSPRIVLACINNLAQVHFLLNDSIQSQRCYRQLRSTVANLNQRRQVNGDRGEGYLQFYWTCAYRGLLQHHFLPSTTVSRYAAAA